MCFDLLYTTSCYSSATVVSGVLRHFDTLHPALVRLAFPHPCATLRLPVTHPRSSAQCGAAHHPCEAFRLAVAFQKYISSLSSYVFSFLLLFSFVEFTYFLWITEVEARNGNLVVQSGFETYTEF